MRLKKKRIGSDQKSVWPFCRHSVKRSLDFDQRAGIEHRKFKPERSGARLN
jgi:hypothetical protein